MVFGDRSPSERSTMTRRLQTMGARVTEVGHWIIGTLPLPGATPDPQAMADRGLAFVEGRDRVEISYGDRVIAETLNRLRSTTTIGQLPGDISLVHVDKDREQWCGRVPDLAIGMYTNELAR